MGDLSRRYLFEKIVMCDFSLVRCSCNEGFPCKSKHTLDDLPRAVASHVRLLSIAITLDYDDEDTVAQEDRACMEKVFQQLPQYTKISALSVQLRGTGWNTFASQVATHNAFANVVSLVFLKDDQANSFHISQLLAIAPRLRALRTLGHWPFPTEPEKVFSNRPIKLDVLDIAQVWTGGKRIQEATHFCWLFTNVVATSKLSTLTLSAPQCNSMSGPLAETVRGARHLSLYDIQFGDLRSLCI